MVFGVVALLVGAFSFTALPKLLGDGNTPPPVAGNTASSGGTQSSETGSNSPSEETTAVPTETPTTTPSESPTESASPSETGTAAGVDYSQAVGVFNGAQRAGIAGTVQSTLVNAGFTNVSAGTWTKKVTYSTIYYYDPSYKAVAEKAGEALGITSILQTTDIPGKVAVVLGTSWNG